MSPDAGIMCSSVHTNTAPFDNQDLRLALKYAINREEIVKRILHGYGGIGNDFPINAAYPLFPADIPQRPYDPDKARHHFKKIRSYRPRGVACRRGRVSGRR